VLGGSATPVNAAEEAMDGFGSLKIVLGAISTIYANYQVRLRPLFKILFWRTNLQDTAVIGNKIEILLSHLAVLEARFATRPSDVAEQRRRSRLIRYAIFPLGARF